MIKTYKHDINDIAKRDMDVNKFIQEHGSYAAQTDINKDCIITTIFYGVRQ